MKGEEPIYATGPGALARDFHAGPCLAPRAWPVPARRRGCRVPWGEAPALRIARRSSVCATASFLHRVRCSIHAPRHGPSGKEAGVSGFRGAPGCGGRCRWPARARTRKKTETALKQVSVFGGPTHQNQGSDLSVDIVKNAEIVRVRRRLRFLAHQVSPPSAGNSTGQIGLSFFACNN